MKDIFRTKLISLELVDSHFQIAINAADAADGKKDEG